MHLLLSIGTVLLRFYAALQCCFIVNQTRHVYGIGFVLLLLSCYLHLNTPLQVRRSSAFADTCTSLSAAAVSALPVGPCVISPAFITPNPGQSSMRSPVSIQHHTDAPSPHAGSSLNGVQQSLDGAVNSLSAEPTPSSTEPLDSSITESTSASGGDGLGSEGSREGGEGRGPRKEFFALVGASMTSISSGGVLCDQKQSAWLLSAAVCVSRSVCCIMMQLCRR